MFALTLVLSLLFAVFVNANLLGLGLPAAVSVVLPTITSVLPASLDLTSATSTSSDPSTSTPEDSTLASSESAAPVSTGFALCPGNAGQKYTDSAETTYSVLCDTAFDGEIISTLSKRQDGGVSDEDCLIACDGLDDCTAIMMDQGSCFLFASVDDATESEGATCVLKVASSRETSTSSSKTSTTTTSSSSILVKVATPVSTGIMHNSLNGTGFPFPKGKIYPTGVFPPRITTVPLISVSGGYLPINHNFTVPYFNPHCPGNATHIHHGTEPCDCRDDHAPTAVASSGFPVNSANATTTTAIPTSGPPFNSANATTGAYMTGTGYRAPRPQNATITTVPLTRVSGGYIPIQHNFTVPYFNPHCPENKTHVHHGTEPCDCVDEPTARPSSGAPIISANATTSRFLTGTAPRQTSRFLTGTAPRPTTVPLMTVSGGYIPIHSNFSGPYVNTHCPNNPHHVHHGTEPCDCVDAPTARPSSGMPINSANATTTRAPSVPLSTGISTSSNTTTAAPYPSNTLCPENDGSTIIDDEGASYLVTCNTVFTGIQMSIAGTLRLRLRQSGDTVSSCMALCDKEDSCSGANVYANNTCEYFSEIDNFVDSAGSIALYKMSGPPVQFSSTSAATSGLPSNSANSTGIVTSSVRANTTTAAVIPLKSVSGGYIPIPANFTLPYVNPHCPGNKTHVHHGTGPCDCDDDDEPTPAPKPIPSTGFTVSANTTTPAPGPTAYPGTISHAMPAPHTAPPAINLTSVSGGYIPVQANFTGSYLNTHCPGNKTHVHHGTEPCDCGDDHHVPTAYLSFGFPRPSANATTTSLTPVQTSQSASESSTVSIASLTSSSVVPTSTYSPVCPGNDGKSFIDDSNAEYTVHCDTSYTGTIIAPALRRRTATDSTQECMAECDGLEACLAITFAPSSCTLFSAINGTSTSPGSVAAMKKLAETISSSSSSTISTSTSSSTLMSTSSTSTFMVPQNTTSAPVVSLTSVSGGIVPIDPHFTGSYLNTLCASNHSHVHHGTEPCDCGLDLPTAGFGLPPTSSPVLASSTDAAVPTSVAPTAAAPVTTSAPLSTSSSSSSLSTAQATTSTSLSTSSSSSGSSTAQVSTSTFVSSAVITSAPVVPLTSISGGVVPIDPHFTGSYLNTLCPENHSHVHHGTEPCDCGLDLPSTSTVHAESTTSTAAATSTTSTSSLAPQSSTSSLSKDTTCTAESHSSTSSKAVETSTQKTTQKKAGTTTGTTTQKPASTSSKSAAKTASSKSAPKEVPNHSGFPWGSQKPSTSVKPTTSRKSSVKPSTSSHKPTTSSKAAPVTSSSQPAPAPESSKAPQPSSTRLPTTSSKDVFVQPSSSSQPAVPQYSAAVPPSAYSMPASPSAVPSAQAQSSSKSSTSASTSTSTSTSSTSTSSTSTSSTSTSISTSSISTSTSSSSSTSTSSVTPTPTMPPACPFYDGKVYRDARSQEYNVACNTAYSGTTIAAKYKRAPLVSDADCMASCDAIDACVAITFISGQCSLFSDISASAPVSGATAAMRVSKIGSSESSSSTSSTISSTSSTPVAAATSPAYAPVPTMAPTISASTSAQHSSTFSTVTKQSTSTKAPTPANTPAPAQAPPKPTQPQAAPPNNANWWQSWWGNMPNWFGGNLPDNNKQPQGQAPPPPSYGRFGFGYKAKAKAMKE